MTKTAHTNAPLEHYWTHHQSPMGDVTIQPAAQLLGFVCGDNRPPAVEQAAAEFLEAVLAAATANGYTRAGIAETVLCDPKADVARRVAFAVEVANLLTLRQYLACLQVLGINECEPDGGPDIAKRKQD